MGIYWNFQPESRNIKHTMLYILTKKITKIIKSRRNDKIFKTMKTNPHAKIAYANSSTYAQKKMVVRQFCQIQLLWKPTNAKKLRTPINKNSIFLHYNSIKKEWSKIYTQHFLASKCSCFHDGVAKFGSTWADAINTQNLKTSKFQNLKFHSLRNSTNLTKKCQNAMKFCKTSIK